MSVFKLSDSGSKRHWLCFLDNNESDKASIAYPIFHVPYPYKKESIPCISKTWDPIKVEIANKNKPMSDIPSVQGPPTFSERAVEALRDMLEPNGELLPFDCADGKYFAFHATTVIDPLVLDETEANWFDKNTKDMARYFVHMVFDKNKLENATIFQIPQATHEYWVTDAFVDRVKHAKLKGFVFEKVWPVEYDPKRHI